MMRAKTALASLSLLLALSLSGCGSDSALTDYTSQMNTFYDAFSSVMLGFFMISNEQKTTYKLLMTKEELDSMKGKWKSASFNAVCLIMQQQLLKSHFEHKIDAFVRAWHIALKFGLTDLGLDEAVIVKHYDNLIR